MRGKHVWLERVLLAFGCACISYYGYMTLEARQFQREQIETFRAGVTGAAGVIGAAGAGTPGVRGAAGVTSAAGASAAPDTPIPPVPPTIGILEIPRLRLTTAVVSGDDAKTLDVAAGHLPDTPRPWEAGNTAIAAHRDGLFRPLKNIKVGDDVRVRTALGDFTYQVRALKIVDPTDLSVLESTGTDTLTLITCYPFNYIGSAPKRFIVHATRVPSGS